MTSLTNTLDAIHTQFRQYDQGVVDFVKGGVPTMQNDKGIPVVMASPDRAFSAMKHLLNVEDIKNIPLPYISVMRTRVLFDPVRFHGPNIEFRKLATSPSGDVTYNSPFPLPYDISYQIEFWAKNRETLNALELWISLQFRNGFEAFLPINFEEVWPSWGTKSVPFENEGIQDNSDLEPKEEHRILRFTQNLTAKAWLLGDVESVKSVMKIFTDAYITDTATDISSVTGPEVDADPATYQQISRTTTDATVDPINTTTQSF